MNRKFKRCLITGITGSGGSYLCEHILSKEQKIKIYGAGYCGERAKGGFL